MNEISRKAAKTQSEEGESERTLHLFFLASSSLCVLAALRGENDSLP
jgi:hypothetical protein